MSERFEKLLKDFFIEIFTQKCLVDDSSITSDEQESISSLSFSEILDNLKNIFLELINFKKSYLEQDKFEILKTNEKFEAMLQKLEAEVRSHIRIEHQLKLHIENNQSQTEELENLNSKLLTQIKDLSDKIKGRSDKKDLEKISKLEALLAKKDQSIAKLESDNLKLRKAVEGKENKSVDGIKQKFEENFSELFRLEQVLKEKSTRVRDRNKSIRKSFAEDQSKVKEMKASAKSLNKIHSRSSSEQVRPVSALRKRC